jgi:hypothetical protein
MNIKKWIMETKLDELKQDFIEKNDLLKKANSILKEEFFGIDHIIDELLEVVASWYTLNFMQDKPLIINLWGLTGVGKTALVTRMVELLEIDNSFFRFDLGDKSGSDSFYSKIPELCENTEDSPIIIALDEFQHARTLQNSFREEIDNDVNRKVWDLIDAGKINYFSWKRRLWSLEDTFNKLNQLIKRDLIKVEKGLVIEGQELFCKEMGYSYDTAEKLHLIGSSEYEDIIDFAGKDLNIKLNIELEKILMKLDEKQSIDFMEKVIKIGKKPSTKYFSKSLIIVMGNIDEAYTMSGQFSADIDADEFYKKSLTIKIPKIKAALKNRFRDEQIARLGNIHLVYPALNKSAFQKIIQKEIKKILKTFEETIQIKCTFEPSLEKTIYEEGVYPVQGVRPVLTTTQHLFKSKLSYFVMQMIKSKEEIDGLNFLVVEDKLVCQYLFNGQLIFSESQKMALNLRKLRENRKDDLQTIVAVHESGHAVLHGILMQKLPENIFSVTSDNNSNGFIYAHMKRDFFVKKDMMNFLACLLGGLVAEEIVFGEENKSSGSGSDIERATDFAFSMLKNEGFSDVPIKYGMNSEANEHVCHNLTDIEQQALELIQQAKAKAFEILTQEKKLLLALAEYLSNHVSIDKEQLAVYFDKFASQKINFEVTNEYRTMLIQAIEANKNSIGSNLTRLNSYQLNKKND